MQFEVSPPIKLEALTPKRDESELRKLLEGRIAKDYIPPAEDISVKSTSTALYETGRKLFAAVDFRRAELAFRLSLTKAYQYGPDDQRFQAARLALLAARNNLTLRTELGYDTDNPNRDVLTGKVTKVFYAENLLYLNQM